MFKLSNCQSCGKNRKTFHRFCDINYEGQSRCKHNIKRKSEHSCRHVQLHLAGFVVNMPLQGGFSRRLLCSTYFDALEYVYFYKAWLRNMSLIGTYRLALPQESGIAIDP